MPFTLDGSTPGYVAAVLGHEHGIGVRSGCFCAQPYVAHLLSLRPAEMLAPAPTGGVDGHGADQPRRLQRHRDVDRVVDAVAQVAAGAVRGAYVQGGDGAWAPGGDREALAR